MCFVLENPLSKHLQLLTKLRQLRPDMKRTVNEAKMRREQLTLLWGVSRDVKLATELNKNLSLDT